MDNGNNLEPLEKEEYAKLEELCRRILVNHAELERHDIGEAVALVGAFAASVQKHMVAIEDLRS